MMMPIRKRKMIRKVKNFRWLNYACCEVEHVLFLKPSSFAQGRVEPMAV